MSDEVVEDVHFLFNDVRGQEPGDDFAGGKLVRIEVITDDRDQCMVRVILIDVQESGGSIHIGCKLMLDQIFRGAGLMIVEEFIKSIHHLE